jgi:hypothetical protein
VEGGGRLARRGEVEVSKARAALEEEGPRPRETAEAVRMWSDGDGDNCWLGDIFLSLLELHS